MRNSYTSIRMAKIEKIDYTKYRQNGEESELNVIPEEKENGIVTLENSLAMRESRTVISKYASLAH